MSHRSQRYQHRRKTSFCLASCPLIVSGAAIITLGFMYLLALATGGEEKFSFWLTDISSQIESSESANDPIFLASGTRKGDLEHSVLKTNESTFPSKIQNKFNLSHRPSGISSVEWPNLPAEEKPLDDYPFFNSLLDIVMDWNPDSPDPPPLFRETLQHFNYSDPKERAMAALFRDSEIPFKIYDIPEVDRVRAKWTEKYLTENLDMRPQSHVERSKDNHFMYWTLGGRRGRDKSYTPPTTIIADLRFSRWLEIAHKADEEKLGPDSEHFYFMSNAPVNDHGRTFISKDLDIFSTRTDNFFITNVAANKGIQCRFGMRGIIAEAHYDSGRNMVAMLKGMKRYILTPPSSCEKLGIITDPAHPSYRHSLIDWSDIDEARSRGFEEVPAIDTIVREGEILYIPSFWFHYIISLQYSVQCNSRSGAPPLHDGKKHIEECFQTKLDFSRYNGGSSIKNLRGH